MTTRCGYRQAAGPDGHLANLRPFKTNSLEGRVGTVSTFGRAPRHDVIQYEDDIAMRGGIIYTVISYATPIAWVCGNGTVRVPDTKYSVTTSKQQGYVCAWLGRKGQVEEFHDGEIKRIIDRDKIAIPL